MKSRVVTQSFAGLLGALAASAACPHIAAAQDATAPSATSSSTSTTTTTTAPAATPVATARPTSTPTSEEVVVTATRSAQKLKDVPESVSVITSDQIADSPAYSLDDILRNVPSVDLPLAPTEQIHPTADSVSMRGLGGNRALVMLDGEPINDAFFGYVQWARVPLESIDQVEVVRGGDSTLWGDHAMGGVINIITKAPTKDELVVQAGGGTYGTYRTNVYGSYLASDRARFSVDYGFSSTDGFQSIPSNTRQPVDTPTADVAHNIAFTGDFDLTSSLSAGLRLSYNEYDEFHQVTVDSNNGQHIWNYAGHITQDFTNGAALTLTAFHSDSHFFTANAGTPDGVTNGASEFTQNVHTTPADDTGASLVWSQSLPGWLSSYSIGVDAHQIEGLDSAVIYADDDGTIEHVRTDIGQGKQIFVGGFAQATLKPIDKLNISAAVRYQYFEDYDGFDGTPGGLGKVADSGDYSFDPRLSVKYALTDIIDVRAAAYESFNAPTLDDLYRSFSTPQGIFQSNAALKPEKLKGGEVGFDIGQGSFSFQGTGYYNYISNLITSESLTAAELPAGFEFGSRNINAGAGVSKGFEASAQWLVLPGLTANFGYTYAYSTVVSNPFDKASVGEQIAGIPRNLVTTGLTYVGETGWRVAPSVRWVSKTYGDNDHTLPLDSHLVVDISGSYPLAQNVEAFVQIQNLLDRKYIALNDGSSPAELGTPFEVFAGARVTF
jgi:outer membrane receptor protein involved in Fe transport